MSEDGIVKYCINSDGVFYSPFTSVLNPLTIFMILTCAMRQKAGVYWCHGYVMLTAALILKLFRRKVIYDVGDDSPSNFSYVIRERFHLCFLAPFAEIIFRAFENFVIHKVNYVLTLTESLKMDREKHVRKIKAIYYGVDPSFDRQYSDKALQGKYASYNIIIYSGTVALQKGFREVLSSFELISNQCPNTLLMIVGGIAKLDKEEVTHALGNRQNVVFTDWLPHSEMAKYITLGKIGLPIISPISYSYKISVPYKLLEQMACGLPVIAPKGFPEIERIVKKANCGFLVDTTKSEEISRAVIKLLEDESLRQQMSNNAVEYIKKYHSLERYQSETIDVFNSVLGNSHV